MPYRQFIPDEKHEEYDVIPDRVALHTQPSAKTLMLFYVERKTNVKIKYEVRIDGSDIYSTSSTTYPLTGYIRIGRSLFECEQFAMVELGDWSEVRVDMPSL